MRFALRNQDKIVQAYDKKTLARVLSSLEKHFSTREVIETEQYDGDKYASLWINDVGHTCGLIGFHVIEIKYDVYRLALREFVS